MLKDTIQIFGWYLRRVPAFALLPGAVGLVNLWAYESFGNGVNLFCGSLMVGYVVLVIARAFAELHRPRAARADTRRPSA